MTPSAELFPVPPDAMMRRVGSKADDSETLRRLYLLLGHRAYKSVIDHLPADWEWVNKRVLDFGSGPGRVIRHFAEHQPDAAYVAYDIDVPMISWLQANISQVQARVCLEQPPLPEDSGSVDLAFAFSVFSHITDQWAHWLTEMHRVLAPGGIFVATFLNEGSWKDNFPDRPPWDEDKIGVRMVNCGQGWEAGGPTVFFSQWFLQEHWGRAFEVLHIQPSGFVPPVDHIVNGQGGVVLRKREVVVSPQDLLAPSDDPRELAGYEDLSGIMVSELGGLREILASQSQQLIEYHRQLTRAMDLARALSAEVTRLSEPR